MISNTPRKTERRQSPRYLLKQPVDVVLDNGNHLNVESRNISSSGLQISCDSWATNEIEPRGIQSHVVRGLRFKIIMALKLEDDTKKLYANCRVISAQRLSQDEYLLSLSFIEFENGSETILEKFLSQFQQTNVVHKGVVGE
jgi:c-di-GMP-binding flagellar brake protein YcgR